MLPELTITSCNAVPAVQDSIYADTCAGEFGSIQNTTFPYSSGAGATEAYLAMLFSKMSIATGDMAYYCYYNWNVCPQPPTIEIQESLYFTSKSNSRKAPAASGMISPVPISSLLTLIRENYQRTSYVRLASGPKIRRWQRGKLLTISLLPSLCHK